MHLSQLAVTFRNINDPAGPDFWAIFWTVIDRVAAIIAIITLPYLVVSYRRRVPRFSFSFSHGNRESYRNSDGINICRFTFSGMIKNQSLDANSIERIHLVVWQNKRRRSTLRDGFGAKITAKGEDLEEPIQFSPREGKKLDIVFEVPTDNSTDSPLALTKKTIRIGDKDWLVLKYDYELMFKDIEGRYFDNNGVLINRKGLELRWTLDNKLAALKGGNPFPFIWQLSEIYISDAVTSVRRAMRRFGV